MAEHFNIIGNYRNKAITNNGEIKVYFSYSSDFDKDSNCEICIHFSRENHDQFYLHENIIGFAKHDYEYDFNDETGELEKASDDKIFHINLFEDMEKFPEFNMILNKSSQLSVSVSTVENPGEFLTPMGKLYQEAVENNKNISKNYLEFIECLRTKDPEKLANYFPILSYMLFTFD